jgi:hypothetical protein
LFEAFLEAYPPDPGSPSLDPRRPRSGGPICGWDELMGAYSGRSFVNGLYRLHTETSGSRMDRIVGELFPIVAGTIYCFGYDWMGYQFALDTKRVRSGEPLILSFNHDTHEAFKIPDTFLDFHTREIVTETPDLFGREFFSEWEARHPQTLRLPNDQCVSYTIPLVLGGQDSVENLELISVEVSWGINGQIAAQLAGLPIGTPITGVRLEE